jgi:hypothetical protein
VSRAGGLAAALVALALLAPRGARAGDGGVATIHVSVSRVKVAGARDAAARDAAHVELVAAAVCAGLQTRPAIACLTATDATNIARLRGLQGLVGGCEGGDCARTDSALATPDDVVQVIVEVKGTGYVLHLVALHPPLVDPVFRADVPAASASALVDVAKAAAVKAAPYLTAH